MLIGISGKIGSGKDTVAKIIKMLKVFRDDVIVKVIKSDDPVILYDNGNYEIKKFAGKLKQIVSILTGIPIEDLEKQEVKDKLLGKEWDLKEKLTENLSIGQLAATPLYGNVPKKDLPEELRITGWTNTHADYWARTIDVFRPQTVRQILQRIGTEAMRDVIHPSVWVNALFADYKALDPENSQSMLSAIDYKRCKFPNWIITDVRFPNEADAIKERGGVLLRLQRDIALDIPSTHPSEIALDNYEDFDHIISNNGTIEELLVKVKDFIENV